MELSKHLKERKPFKINYDGEDFGIYIYNQEKDRYEGKIGHIDFIDMVKIIKDENNFIKLEPYEIEKN